MPNLKIGPDDFTGGSGSDEYFSKVKVSGGNRLNTLETGDRIDGRGNRDTLDAELSDEGGSYFVRPTLISIEKARFSVVTPDDDSEGVTVNLNQSEDLDTIVNYRSLGDLTLNNTDDVQKFYWKNGESGDFTVNDLSADYYSFEITNTGEGGNGGGINPGFTQNISFDIVENNFLNLYVDGDDAIRSTFILEDAFVNIYADNFVDVARLTVSNSQVYLDIGTNKISFDSLNSVNGEDTDNSVYFVDGITVTRFAVTGDSRIEFDTGINETGPDIVVNEVFDASGNSGGIDVEADISGDFKRLSGSTGDDYFQNITSTRSGDVRIGFRGGDVGANEISSSNATKFSVNTSTLVGESAQIGSIASSSTAAGATVNLIGGDGGDEIGGFVIDPSAPIFQARFVVDLGAGLDITGTASANVHLNGGQDVLLVSSLNGGVANTIDMGNGKDTLDVTDADGLNLNDEGGTAPVTTLDGGVGKDTLVAEFTDGFASGVGNDTVANVKGQIVNFETLILAQESGGTFDMDALTDVDTVQLGEGLFGFSDTEEMDDAGGQYEFLNVNAGTTFVVAEGALTIGVAGYENDSNQNLVVTNPMPTPVDLTLHADTGVTSTTVQMGEAFDSSIPIGATYFADVTVDGFTTLDVVSEGPHITDPTSGDRTFNAISITDETTSVDILTTINITGVENIAVRIEGDAVETVDASALSGDLDLLESSFSQSVDITGGSGDDSLIGSEEADTFDLGQGGDDFILFVSADDSDLAIGQSDAVTGFSGGSFGSGDKLVFNSAEFGSGNPDDDTTTTIGRFPASRAYTLAEANNSGGAADGNLVFLGNANTFAQAQATVMTNDQTSHDYIGAVYDRSTHTLYIDVDHDGDLQADDFALQLDASVDTINARDLFSADLIP